MAKRPVATDRVRTEWLRRVEAEYRSASIVQHLTLWLMQIGASPDLVHIGLRIAADEMKHAAMSHRCYVAAGGQAAPVLPRESLGLHARAGEPLERDVLRVVVETFCLGETVAVPLFKLLRDGATVPVAKRALDRILVDEVRHRDFGWICLDWLLCEPDAPAYRVLIDNELPGYFAQLRASYLRTGGTLISAEDRSWGLMDLAQYAQAVDSALTRDWLPRFAKLGIDARVAWDKHLPAAT
jgi:hypothetical protein